MLRLPRLAPLLLLLACDRPREPAPRPTPAPPAPASAPGPASSASASASAAAPAPEPAADPSVVPLPDSLAAQGVPAIPRALADAVGTYSEARSASVYDWHPRERTLLIGTRFADTTQVHEVRFAGGARRQLTFFRDPVTQATYAPAGDGSSFLFAKDIGGNEFAQNWRLDRATGQVTLLTDGGSKNTMNAWTRRGDVLAYTSTRRTKKDTDLYLVDPRDPSSDRRIAEVEGGGWRPLDFSADDLQVLVQNYISANEAELWIFGVVSGERRKLVGRVGDEPVYWGDAAFLADGAGVLAISDAGGEFRRLVRVALADGAVTAFGEDVPWDISSVTLSERRDRVVATVNEGGTTTLRSYDLPSGRPRPLPATPPAGVISNMRWHRDGQALAMTISSARSPSDVYVLDLGKKRLERWTESEVGGLDPSGFSEPEIVRWPSFDGREIPGLYYRPAARFTGKRPVIINIHGGPESQSQVGFIGRTNYYLNELGVAVIFPNVRGSSGYGKTYLRLDNDVRREDSVKDIGALLDWIATRPELDAERVMVMGGSYGGYMTLAASVHYADRIRCAIDVVGISNFVTFLENTEAYRRDLRRAEYGDERDPAIRQKLLEFSPLTHAGKIKRPLFVVQGRNDPRVPASEAHQIVETLGRAGTPVWYLEGKNEGHGFARKVNQDYLMYAQILFMKRYLLDGLPEGG